MSISPSLKRLFRWAADRKIARLSILLTALDGEDEATDSEEAEAGLAKIAQALSLLD